MRLKEDKSSYRGIGLAKKQEPIPETVRTKSKKNTRKWCKGKVGVEHELELKDLARFDFYHWYTDVCKNCGKQFYRFSNHKPIDKP